MEIAYAQALWDVIAGGGNPKQAVASVRESLVANGRQHLLPRIVRAFKRIAERELRKSRVTLSVASKKDLTAVPRTFNKVFKQAGIDTKHIETVIDESLVGGWRLEGQEQLIDASYKKQLLEIYNRVTEK